MLKLRITKGSFWGLPNGLLSAIQLVGKLYGTKYRISHQLGGFHISTIVYIMFSSVHVHLFFFLKHDFDGSRSFLNNNKKNKAFPSVQKLILHLS
jgi:hypothetical protein